MEMIRRIGLISVLAGFAVAANASPATASVTIGQTDGPLSTCSSGFDWVAETTPAPANSYVVPTVGGISAWTVTSWATNAGGQTGDSLEMKIFRKVAGPATYQVIGHSGPETLTVPDKNTFPASVPTRAGDLLGFHTGTDNQFCTIQPVTGATIRYFEGDLTDEASAAFSQDTNYLLNIEATLEPDNSFTLGTLTRNKKKGTATLAFNLPNPGDFSGSGQGAQVASNGAVTSKAVPAGIATLVVKATGKKR